MFLKEFINYDNKLYSVYRKVKNDSIKEEFIQDMKIFWNCDIVVKSQSQNGELFLFLREIPEVELVD
jgi:hypothetical protein